MNERTATPLEDTATPLDDSADESSTASAPDSGQEAGPSSSDSAPAPLPLPGRYVDLGAVARGSFGEIRRVRDVVLDRVLAMKVLHADLSARPWIRRRFFTEVQITAQLQHPGIVPVYDHGELPDGRLWYAMKEVRGRTLGAILREVFEAASAEGFGTTPSGWTFRRVVDVFARIAQTVAYAHRQGCRPRTSWGPTTSTSPLRGGGTPRLRRARAAGSRHRHRRSPHRERLTASLSTLPPRDAAPRAAPLARASASSSTA